MDDDPLARYELVYLLGMAFQQVVSDLVNLLDAAGYEDLRPVHGFALQVIAAGGDVTATDLGARLGVTKQAGAQLVDYLLARGYVETRVHPRGGRRRSVVLSARGQQHLREAGAVLHRMERAVLSALPPERRDDLRSDLVTIIRQGTAAPDVPPLRPVW